MHLEAQQRLQEEGCVVDISGRGEGDDNGAEGTIVPQPTDPPGRLQGFRGQCQTGPREFGSSGTRGMTMRPHGGLVIAMSGSYCGRKVCFVRYEHQHPTYPISVGYRAGR